MRHGGEWARERFGVARVARLATVGGDGSPHLVPITFTLTGEMLISAIDHKPKSTTALRRLDNIAQNPFVSVLVDEYDDDWSQLWWARADGWARTVPAADVPEFDTLIGKYPAYGSQPPDGLVVVVTVDSWSGWSAS